MGNAMVHVIKEINLEAIVVDRAYQRPLDKQRVAKIIALFDARAVNQPHVNLRPNNQYYLMDGQHTVDAFRKMGLKTIECKVYDNLTLQEEAYLFGVLNNPETKKAQTSVQMTKSKEVAGDVDVLSMKSKVESVGYAFRKHDDRMDTRPLAVCMATLSKAQQLGQKSFDKGLELYGMVLERNCTMEGMFIRGFVSYFALNEKCGASKDVSEVARALTAFSTLSAIGNDMEINGLSRGYQGVADWVSLRVNQTEG
jgi:uncharacterized ParB-like nuclease family protein